MNKIQQVTSVPSSKQEKKQEERSTRQTLAATYTEEKS